MLIIAAKADFPGVLCEVEQATNDRYRYYVGRTWYAFENWFDDGPVRGEEEGRRYVLRKDVIAENVTREQYDRYVIIRQDYDRRMAALRIEYFSRLDDLYTAREQELAELFGEEVEL